MTNSKTNMGRALAGGGIAVTEWQLSIREVSILAEIVGGKPIVSPQGGGNNEHLLYFLAAPEVPKYYCLQMLAI